MSGQNRRKLKVTNFPNDLKTHSPREKVTNFNGSPHFCCSSFVPMYLAKYTGKWSNTPLSDSTKYSRCADCCSCSLSSCCYLLFLAAAYRFYGSAPSRWNGRTPKQEGIPRIPVWERLHRRRRNRIELYRLVVANNVISKRLTPPEITEQILQILKPQSERLEIEFKQMLDALAECFRQGDCRVQLPTVRGALSEMDDAIQQIRDREMLADLALEPALRVFELVERYHATCEALEECGRLVRTLEIQRYWGDYAL
jgi:hypothetical protein